MDFEEFLIACNEYDLINLIKENFIHIIPIPESIHKKALSLYHSYLFVGGMPRIVNDFIVNDKNVMNCDRELINSFQTSYLADMTKHISTPAESLKIIETYNSISRQLSKENPKFMYKTIRNNANKRDFSSSIDWLLAAGIVYKVNNVSAIRSPLKSLFNSARKTLVL